MDKEKLLSELKKQVGTTSLSERTISEYADNILPTVTDETPLDAHARILKALEGQLNHDVATKVNGFKADWEKEHPLQEPPKVESFKDSEEYKSLVDKLSELETARESEAKAAKIASLRNSVMGKAGEIRVSNKNLWNDVVKSLDIADGATAEDVLTSAKSTYEAKLKAYMPSAVPFGAGGNGTPDAAPKAEAEARRAAFKARMIAEGRLPEEAK